MNKESLNLTEETVPKPENVLKPFSKPHFMVKLATRKKKRLKKLQRAKIAKHSRQINRRSGFGR